MKAIQITVDEEFLARFDRDPEVKRLGRSAVLRRAAEAYLRDRRKRAIAAAYRQAYKKPRNVGDLDGWSVEGEWPQQ
jgi:metal-responsive CopG/Arc/MetJ family transcriptional regulator